MFGRRLAAGLMLFLSACQPKAFTSEPVPAAFAPEDRIEVWVRRRPLVLREVVVGADSIRGRTVPRFPGAPDSAVALARADVDSIRVRRADVANWTGIGFLGGFLAGALGMLLLVRSSGGT